MILFLMKLTKSSSTQFAIDNHIFPDIYPSYTKPPAFSSQQTKPALETLHLTLPAAAGGVAAAFEHRTGESRDRLGA